MQLARYQYFNGKRRLTQNYGDSTDDRGEFRIFGVPPADYMLVAMFSEQGDRSTDRLRYVPSYYPGTASAADAQRVQVKLGGELSGLSIALLRKRTATVSGVVRSTTPSPFTFVDVRRTDGQDSGSPFDTVDQRGAFTITGLLPGSYVINAQNPFGNERGSVDVKVGDTDVAGVAAVLGTRFLLTEESRAHPDYKRRALTGGETLLTELFGAGWPAPHRVLPNAATERWLRQDERGVAEVAAGVPQDDIARCGRVRGNGRGSRHTLVTAGGRVARVSR